MKTFEYVPYELRHEKTVFFFLFVCFCYSDSTIHHLHVHNISSFLSSPVTVQAGLCQTWSETPKTGFLALRLIYDAVSNEFLQYKTRDLVGRN